MGRRILIIEDEEILADNLKAYLERSSLVAEIAPDGASAIRLAESFTPECVVLDYRLPDMDGFDALDCLRRQCGHLSCVLITGHPTSEVYAGAARRGIEHILFKPFPLSELSSVVQGLANQVPAPGTAPGEAPAAPYTGVERRHGGKERFPMRLFDGSWLHADRRHPADVRTDRNKD